jgi:hypothetical protein
MNDMKEGRVQRYKMDQRNKEERHKKGVSLRSGRVCIVLRSLTGLANLTFQSLAVTLFTARFSTKKFYVVPTLHLCVLYGSQNKQQLLPYKTVRDWFL